jgi:hypothetical protein
MARKLEKSSFPAGHGPGDFQCFGPPALNDGDFDTCKIADMGSFSQDEKDSNKYYHAAIIKSKINGLFYVYFEWGRVGAKSPQFQIVECSSEAEAQREFAAQCHEKNDKRGMWDTVAGIRTLTAKPGKDVYLVRQLTTRSTGLPDAKTIKYVDPNTKKAPADAKAAVKSGTPKRKADQHTSRLLTDLIGGTIKYTRSTMADDSLPTQTAIDQARMIITEAQKRLSVVGGDLDHQIADKELRQYSGELYRRIPKIKAVGTPDSEWILSQNNIFSWNQDLDAFESALTGQASVEEESDNDSFHGLPLHMEWVDPKSALGQFLMFWWPKATLNKHGWVGEMKIKNLWKVDRFGDDEKFIKMQDSIHASLKGKKISERPLCQPNERQDLADQTRREISHATNSGLLFHGTRTVNVKGILEKSLLLPKQLVGVSINGAMFGPGLYWADDWKKSAGYTSLRGSIWSGGSGGVQSRAAFMFAADVVLGEPHVAPGPHGYTAPPNGAHCVFGMGRNHPTAKNRGSGVENNEWIVFHNAQSRLRYLAEFDTTSR